MTWSISVELMCYALFFVFAVFGGRAMTGHFATHYLDENGAWLNQLSRYNSTADLSPTAAQMPKLVGLGYASKLYRHPLPDTLIP